MVLPTDDYILLSLINTKLRDGYPSFDELCEEEGLNAQEIRTRLARIGAAYNEELNAFR